MSESNGNPSIGELSRRLDRVEVRFETLEDKVDRILEILTERHTSNLARLTAIEAKLCPSPGTCVTHTEVLKEFGGRLSRLELSLSELRGIGIGVRAVWLLLGGLVVSITTWILSHLGLTPK